MRTIALLLATALTLETLSSATALSAGVTPGTRVRLTGPEGGRRIGSFHIEQRDSIWIRTCSGSDSLLGMRELDVRRLEISRGVHGDGGRAALLGAFIGIAGGMVIGAASYRPDDWPLSRGSLATIGAVGFGLAGLLVGGIISVGSSVERWDAVPVEALRSDSAPPDSTR